MKVTDSNKYYLDVIGQPKRFVHLATVQNGPRCYIAIWDRVTGKLHLNDYTSGRFNEIETDEEFMEIEKLLFSKKITTIEQDQPIEEFPWQIKDER